MRPPTSALSRQLLICSLVIALTSKTVIQCTSSSDSKPAPGSGPTPLNAEPVKVDLVSEASAKAASEPAPKSAPVEPGPGGSGAEQEASARKGRSEPPPQTTERPPLAAPADKEPASKSAGEQKAVQKATGSGKPTSTSGNKSQLAGKSGSSSSSTSSTGKKLPANLGTVTSTGSGGPAHYMSKHDAYSAIAEKHGALAQDAMRKADRRQHLQRFGGIQKASGFGDVLSPFKGVTDSGLARTLGASVRSIMKGKYSVPAYVASAVLGAVALMAFYESPISPLPVPPLPEPPVGRFPPEMPNISPNLQVPFRMNQGQGQGQGQGQQQQQYGQAYQRSSGPQQVLFPGATAQQRQATGGPVQTLAANLISSVGANRPAAQRKSGLDYEPSTSRSFFGSSASSAGQQQTGANVKLSAPANSQQSLKQGGGASSLLNFFGLGGSSSGDQNSAASALANLDIQRASSLNGHQIAAGGGPVSSASGTEMKGQSALSNSHLVNKMKSYFDRPLGHTIWPMEHYTPNQYDQYRRMSIVQALAKDTAFLSSFFSPSRRSANATGPLVTANQLQQSISNILAAAAPSAGSASSAGSQPAGGQQAASARMQVDSVQPTLFSPLLQQQQPQAPVVSSKRVASSYGLMRAADRIARTLLDTFTSGLLHRSSSAGLTADSAAIRKSEEQQNAIASATSLLSDFMSTYNAQNAAAAVAQPSDLPPNKQQTSQERQSPTSEQASGRSADQQSGLVAAQSESQASAVAAPKQAAAQQQSAPEAVNSASQPTLVRKTRSIGLEYPTAGQVHQQPSRASQINNLVDMVSDSYKQNKLLFNFVMNQVGLSHAVPYVDQFLGSPNELHQQYS